MKEELKILILEDSSDDVSLIERVLKKAGLVFKAQVVNKGEEFERSLSDFGPDVVLSDHSLPDFNSIEALRIFKEFRESTDSIAPFILVTGAVSEEFAVQCIKSGADDYILKDRLKRLPTSITIAIEKARIDRERRKVLDDIVATQSMMREAERLANFGSWQADLVSGEHTWSDECYRLYGYAPGEVAPSYELFLRHVHPEDVHALKQRLDGLMENGDTLADEFRIVGKNGKGRFIAVRVSVKRDNDGRPVFLTGFNLDITEKKNAELRLRKSEQEYKSLFDLNPDAVFSLDTRGDFTKINAAGSALSGFDAETLLNQHFKPIIADEDVEGVEKHFQATLQGIPQRFEAKLMHPSGKIHFVDVTNIPIKVNDEIVGVHGIAKDITKRKDLERLLDKANRMAMIGGWELELVTSRLNWTSITREIHEVEGDYEPTLETSIAFYKEGECRRKIAKAVKNCIEKGLPFDLELQIITARGNERWVRAIGEAEFKNDRVARIYGSFQDIHVRKQAELKVKEAYQERVDILESIQDAFFAVDRNWTVTYWNKMAETHLGMPKRKVVGKNIWELYPDAARTSFFAHYQRAMEEGVSVHFQEYYPPLNMWVDVSVFPSPTGLSVYFRDITASKNYIRTIEENNRKLMEIAWIQSHQVWAPLARLTGLVHLLRNYPENNTDCMDLILASAKELDAVITKIVRKTEEIDLDDAYEKTI